MLKARYKVKMNAIVLHCLISLVIGGAIAGNTLPLSTPVSVVAGETVLLVCKTNTILAWNFRGSMHAHWSVLSKGVRYQFDLNHLGYWYLSIANVTSTDSGEYYCENLDGAVNSYRLYVYDTAALVSIAVKAIENESVTLECVSNQQPVVWKARGGQRPHTLYSNDTAANGYTVAVSNVSCNLTLTVKISFREYYCEYNGSQLIAYRLNSTVGNKIAACKRANTDNCTTGSVGNDRMCFNNGAGFVVD